MKFRREQFAGMNQHYRRYTFSEFLDSMQACGIISLEMWCGAPHFMLDSVRYSDCRRIESMARERGLRFVSLTSPSMQWQYQCASHVKEHREKSVLYFSNGVRAAAELGCSVMSVNSGWGFWDDSGKEAWEWSVETIARVADVAQKEGIKLALESLQPSESNLVLGIDDAKKFIDALKHPAVELMIDSVAVGVAGETPEQWFEAFGGRIIHCHLVDGAPSGHMVWGEGQYSLEDIMHAFYRNKYKGIFTMELGSRYLSDPFSADRRNMQVLSRYIEN
jgi:protein FrlC